MFDGPAGSISQPPPHGPGQAMEPSLDLESLLMLPSGSDLQPTSPVGSEGYTSETSSGTNCNQLDSPASSMTSVLASGGGGAGGDQRGAESSSPTQSPLVSFSDAMMSQWSPGTTTVVAGNGQEMERQRGSGSESWSDSPPSYSHPDNNSADVRIDLGKSIVTRSSHNEHGHLVFEPGAIGAPRWFQG